jgi:hypothetical protein
MRMNMQVSNTITLSITEVCPVSAEVWDKIWQECDYATYFHSREWAEIWHTYTQGVIHPAPKLILFSDGKKALIPLSCEKRYKGLLNLYLSSPEGCFGGWLSTDKLQIDHAKLMINYMTKKLGGSLIWRFNPYDTISVKLMQLT